MKATANCRLLTVCAALAVLMAAAGLGVHTSLLTGTAIGSTSLLADGGAPEPPPIPMAVRSPSANAAPTYFADGGAPEPPPIPMAVHSPSANAAFTYFADGGAPEPPPIPMHSFVV